MKWMNKMEKKFGKYAISNLMYYIIILYGAGFVMETFQPGIYWTYFALNPTKILEGEVWRIVTFVLQPPDSSILMTILILFIYYSLGRHLEYMMGAFRFNLYFFTGLLLHVIAAFVAYFVTGGYVYPINIMYFNMSLFFIYATLFPEQQFLLMLFIPVKGKWLAWIDAVYFGYTIIQPFLESARGDIWAQGNAIAAFVSLLNCMIFFLTTRKYSIKQVQRRRVYKMEVRLGQESQDKPKGARHKCHVCGRTELDDPNLEFRYCSKCNGNYEYCQEHLFTHEHVK